MFSRTETGSKLPQTKYKKIGFRKFCIPSSIQLCSTLSVLRIRIWDPVLVWPLDPNPGWVLIPDPGSTTHISESLVPISKVKNALILYFFQYLFKNKKNLQCWRNNITYRGLYSIQGTCLEIDIHGAGPTGEPGYSPGQHNLQRHHGYRQHRQLVLVTQQTILNKQCCRSGSGTGSGLDLDSMGSRDPYSDPEDKNDPQTQKKVNKFNFLKYCMFSFDGWRLFL